MKTPGGNIALNETDIIFRGGTVDTMKDKQQYFKYDTRFNGQPMQGMKDWADVVFISSECYETSCRILKSL